MFARIFEFFQYKFWRTEFRNLYIWPGFFPVIWVAALILFYFYKCSIFKNYFTKGARFLFDSLPRMHFLFLDILIERKRHQHQFTWKVHFLCSVNFSWQIRKRRKWRKKRAWRHQSFFQAKWPFHSSVSTRLHL